ncbi:hypothetical protein PPACK8108_LOCUS7240 [Phakopsora pachyrhizi]|uniref:Uncharacterized protein n=1 Tax=Phakopsora pachyrhizi TaxID=170000 RepID=A0AAV0AUB7_PHAPC|nr:hypothetical protein PPACK8108_LOCUS7240 [Phakopsora pachyrhizi]
MRSYRHMGLNVGYETEGSRQQQKIEGHRNKVKAADEDMMATQVLAGEWHNTGIRLYRDSPWWMTSCSFRKVGAWTVVGCLRMVFDVAGVVKAAAQKNAKQMIASRFNIFSEVATNLFAEKLALKIHEKDELLKRIVPARQGMKLWILRMFEDRSVENTSDFGSEDIEIHREEAQPRFSHDTVDIKMNVLETVEEQLELDATVLRGQSLTEPPLAAHIFDQNHSPVVSQSRWEMCLTRSFTIRSRIFIKSTRAMKTTGPTAQPPTHSYETQLAVANVIPTQ